MNPIFQRAVMGVALRRFLLLCFMVLLTGLGGTVLANQHGGIAAQEIYPTGQPTRIAPLIPELYEEAASSPSQDVVMPFREVFHGSPHHTDWALLVPLFAVIFLFGGPVVVIIVVAMLHFRSKARRTELRAQIILKALETGRDLPEALLPGDDAPTGNVNLRRGVRNIGLGFAILLPLGILAGFEVGALGFIPMSIGVAQVALWRWADRSAGQG